MVSGRSLIAFRRRVLEWYRAHQRALPFRGTRDPYRIWISEVMLQQTRVAAVLPYYRRFLRRFPNVRALARARSEEVLKHWAGLGYYSRARNLHRAAKKIVAKHNGKFPHDLDAALALPGVGHYTAAAVLSIAYNAPLAVLDGNVARVLARVFAIRGDAHTPQQRKVLERLAQELMPGLRAGRRALECGARAPLSFGRAQARPQSTNRSVGEQRCERGLASAQSKVPRRAGAHTNALGANRDKTLARQAAPLRTKTNDARPAIAGVRAGDWNQAMMELGATLCTPRAPRCDACPVARWCDARRLGIAEQLPAARNKRAPVKIRIAAAVLLDTRGRTLLLEPGDADAAGLFSHMRHFPAVEVRNDAAAELRERLRAALDGSGTRLSAASLVALPPARHSVTFREITLLPFLARVENIPAFPGGRISPLAAMDRLAVSSATRKIAKAALRAVGFM